MDQTPAPVTPPPSGGNFWAGIALALVLGALSLFIYGKMGFDAARVVPAVWLGAALILMAFRRHATLGGLLAGMWFGFVIGAILVAALFVYLLAACARM